MNTTTPQSRSELDRPTLVTQVSGLIGRLRHWWATRPRIRVIPIQNADAFVPKPGERHVVMQGRIIVISSPDSES